MVSRPPSDMPKGLMAVSFQPVADACQATRLCAHVDVVLQKVGVVGHQRPIVFKEARELRDKIVERRTKTHGQSLLELREFC